MCVRSKHTYLRDHAKDLSHDQSHDKSKDRNVYSSGIHVVEFHAGSIGGVFLFLGLFILVALLTYYIIKRCRRRQEQQEQQAMQLQVRHPPPSFPPPAPPGRPPLTYALPSDYRRLDDDYQQPDYQSVYATPNTSSGARPKPSNRKGYPLGDESRQERNE